MSTATSTGVRALSYKKISKLVFVSTGSNSKIWEQTVLREKAFFFCTSLFQFLLHLARNKNAWSNRKSQEHTACGKKSLRGAAIQMLM